MVMLLHTQKYTKYTHTHTLLLVMFNEVSYKIFCTLEVSSPKGLTIRHMKTLRLASYANTLTHTSICVMYTTLYTGKQTSVLIRKFEIMSSYIKVHYTNCF